MSRTHAVLLLQLLSVHYGTQSDVDIEAVCGQDVILPCPDVTSKHGDFFSVIWSKGKFGLIMWSAKGTKSFNFPRETGFGGNHSLMLPRATPEDSGEYECEIRANVGGQNLYPKVNLTVHECVTQFERTTIVSNSTPSCHDKVHDKVHDLPLMWSAAGYLAVALAKITLSLISIWVLHKRHSRQQQNRWTHGLQASKKTSY